MSFKAQDLSDDAKLNSSEVTVASSVTRLSSEARNKNRQSDASEDKRDSASAVACIDENFNTISGEVSELSVNSDEPAIDTRVISRENCTTSSNAMESLSDKKTADLPNNVELHSVVEAEVRTESGLPSIAKLPSSHSTDTRNDEGDAPSLLSLTMALIPDEVLIESSSGNERKYQSDSDSSDGYSDVITDDGLTASVDVDSCSANLTSTDTSKSAVPDVGADVEKTDGKFVSPASFMPPVERRSRPVPLPRSNTFRTKSASGVLTTPSNRSSIPVQYETCSSIESKICQTMALGDECESEYLLPVDFSNIYVDHKMVEEWHDQKSAESAVYISSYDSDYDVLSEVVSTSEGFKVLSHTDSRTTSGGTEVLPSYESDYELVKDDIWHDVYDASNVAMHRQTEVKAGHTGLRTESGYDCLRDDVWTSSGVYEETEIVPESGLPPSIEEHTSHSAATWHHLTDVPRVPHVETPTPPVDVRAKYSIILTVIIFLGRIACTTYVDAAYCYRLSSMVCLSVSLSH